jgi:PhnB protein
MARVNTYLNFQGSTEEAFDFYASLFSPAHQLEFQRFGDMDEQPGMPPLSDEDKRKVLHVELPILTGHVIMGTDMLESMDQKVRVGNNTTISLELDSRQEATDLYDQLAAGGSEGSGMMDMPWGAYWGCCLDRFDIRWMITHTEQ